MHPVSLSLHSLESYCPNDNESVQTSSFAPICPVWTYHGSRGKRNERPIGPLLCEFCEPDTRRPGQRLTVTNSTLTMMDGRGFSPLPFSPKVFIVLFLPSQRRHWHRVETVESIAFCMPADQFGTIRITMDQPIYSYYLWMHLKFFCLKERKRISIVVIRVIKSTFLTQS